MLFQPGARARVPKGPRANCYVSILELYICFYALLSAYICDIYIIQDTRDGEHSQSARNPKTIKSSLCLYSCHLMKWLEAEDDFIVRAEGHFLALSPRLFKVIFMYCILIQLHGQCRLQEASASLVLMDRLLLVNFSA